MKALKFMIATLLLSACAVYAQLAWSTMRWPMVLQGPGVDADMIRSHFPFHLISPDWIRASGQELVIRWRGAEFYARSALVCLIWLVSLMFAFRWARRDAEQINRPDESEHRRRLI
ncbi:MAG TPA: hypothetical protein VEH04_07370 [Verrucomicrobiae bacterium]|nr:hypothetical protein [Verrucomicrobiae bacterium]